jgi:hypothetical protein
MKGTPTVTEWPGMAQLPNTKNIYADEADKSGFQGSHGGSFEKVATG